MSDLLAEGPLPVRTRRGFSRHPAWLCGVLLILTIVIGLHHGQLGMQVVIEDYVHNDGVKLALIVAVRFLAVLFGLAAVVAIMRIGFGG